MLTVADEQNLAGQEVELPTRSAGIIGRASRVMASTTDGTGRLVAGNDEIPGLRANQLACRPPTRAAAGDHQ